MPMLMLMLCGYDLPVISNIGIILLIAIVKKNAIIGYVAGLGRKDVRPRGGCATDGDAAAAGRAGDGVCGDHPVSSHHLSGLTVQLSGPD
jgi:hypothetical protein